jgi:hypothetical protein
MNVDTATKSEIFARINEIRETLGDAPLAAYKAKDMTKDALVELLKAHEDAAAASVDEDAVQEDAAEELDEATTQPVSRSRYNEAGLRRCGCCGNYFAPSAFGEYKRSKDGLASYTREHTASYRAKKS